MKQSALTSLDKTHQEYLTQLISTDQAYHILLETLRNHLPMMKISDTEKEDLMSAINCMKQSKIEEEHLVRIKSQLDQSSADKSNLEQQIHTKINAVQKGHINHPNFDQANQTIKLKIDELTKNRDSRHTMGGLFLALGIIFTIAIAGFFITAVPLALPIVAVITATVMYSISGWNFYQSSLLSDEIATQQSNIQENNNLLHTENHEIPALHQRLKDQHEKISQLNKTMEEHKVNKAEYLRKAKESHFATSTTMHGLFKHSSAPLNSGASSLDNQCQPK